MDRHEQHPKFGEATVTTDATTVYKYEVDALVKMYGATGWNLETERGCNSCYYDCVHHHLVVYLEGCTQWPELDGKGYLAIPIECK